MDLDRFVASNQPVWDRLDTLVRKGSRGAQRLDPAELDELVALYQRVSTHLSMARTSYGEPGLTAVLTRLTARAGSVVYGTRPVTVRAFARFWTTTFPAALWHARRFILISALLFLLPAAALGLWLANSPAAQEAAIPAELRQAFAEDFETYYSENPSAVFAASVTTNNIQVAFLAFAGGILGCVLTVLVLVQNGANLGGAMALYSGVRSLEGFFGYILPHGLLELTAIFIAGGAGLQLGWALIDPGDRPRTVAVLEEGRRAVVIVLGLVAVFVFAGAIEGFVTGSALPTWARVGIGATAWVAFAVYAVLLGRAAASRGLTGAIGEQDEAGWAR